MKKQHLVAPIAVGAAFVCALGLAVPSPHYAAAKEESSGEAYDVEEGEEEEEPEYTENEEDTAEKSEAPAEATVTYTWKGKEIIRETIQNGKKIYWYSTEDKSTQVQGSPLTVDTATLHMDLETLLSGYIPYKAGYDINWHHEFDNEGNLHIWPSYYEVPGTPEEAVKDEAPYTFKFDWKKEGTKESLPWYIVIPSIMNNQPVNKVTADQVKAWLDSMTPTRSTVVIDENDEYAPEQARGAYEFVGLEGDTATGNPKGERRLTSNIGYWRFTPLAEYRERLAEEEKARLEAEEKAHQEAEAAAKAEAEEKARQEAEAAAKAAEEAARQAAEAEAANEKSEPVAETTDSAAEQATPEVTELPETSDASSIAGALAGFAGIVSAAGAAILRRKH